ncbi:MAG: exodeoxyribonuclease V subunit gamma, partial [Xanthomonadaceae bacterium]|nr:exodeoxyribonuclease V subunit gamma [Xanthomonadaceae bacterium]
ARLADALGGQLRAARDNPLVPARVLVPHAGIRRWLQVHLAERLGVIASVCLPRAQGLRRKAGGFFLFLRMILIRGMMPHLFAEPAAWPPRTAG